MKDARKFYLSGVYGAGELTKELQEAYGEAMLELRARKKLQSLLGKDET